MFKSNTMPNVSPNIVDGNQFPPNIGTHKLISEQ